MGYRGCGYSRVCAWEGGLWRGVVQGVWLVRVCVGGGMIGDNAMICHDDVCRGCHIPGAAGGLLGALAPSSMSFSCLVDNTVKGQFVKR